MIVYLLALAVLLYGFQRVSEGSLWLSLVFLPGVVVHESCHYIVGKAMNGNPISFSVWPREREGRYVLGSVGFTNLRWYNAFFIGMAPLVMFPGAYYLLMWRVQTFTLNLKELVFLYLIANLISVALPSPADVKIAWGKSPIGYLLILGSIIYAWHRFF